MLINNNKKRLFEVMGKLNPSFLNENVIRRNPNHLYHVTNIKNADDIRKYGLYPMFGDTLKVAYGSDYDFDGEDKIGDEYDGDPYKKVKLDYEGVLFFAEEPAIKYTDFHMGNTNNQELMNQAALVIVEKNDTIYHKIDDEKVTDYSGNPVDYVPANREEYGGFPTYELPIFIERGDWFSFEEQEPVAVLTGNDLVNFMKVNNFKI